MTNILKKIHKVSEAYNNLVNYFTQSSTASTEALSYLLQFDTYINRPIVSLTTQSVLDQYFK